MNNQATTSSTTRTLGDNIADAIINSDKYTADNQLSTSTLAANAQLLVNLITTDKTEAAANVRAYLIAIDNAAVDTAVIAVYAVNNNVTVTDATDTLLDTIRRLQSVKKQTSKAKAKSATTNDITNVIKTNRAKAANTAVRRKLPRNIVLEISKTNNITDKSIQFRELSIEELAVVDAKETLAAKQKADKIAVKKAKEEAEKESATDSGLVAIIIGKLSDLDADLLQTLTNAVQSENLKRINQGKTQSTVATDTAPAKTGVIGKAIKTANKTTTKKVATK